MKNYPVSGLLQLCTAPDKRNEITFYMSQFGPAEKLPSSTAMWVEFYPQYKRNKRLDVNTARASLFPQTWPAHSAVNLRFLSADHIHSDRCRVPLDSLLCLTVTPSTRSLWTDTHTHAQWWQRWAWFEVSCLWRCSCIKETAAEISQAASPCLLVSITHKHSGQLSSER